MRCLLLVFCLFFTSALPGGNLETEFISVVSRLQDQASQPFGSLVVAAGGVFLDKPYEGKTLECAGPEELVVRFASFDCFTLMETALALARTVKKGEPTLADYSRELTRLRYRDGRLDGWPSRLHYTSDWAADNQKRGLVRDITRSIGGQPYGKRIDFMTTHRQSYQQLASDDNHRAMQRVEEKINREQRFYIPKARIRDVEDKVQDGDLIALTTPLKGLDVGHVGLAVRQKGRLHLLHASSKNGRVEISVQPLHEFLAPVNNRHGIMVFRPLPP
ncbi:MAG: DUF1460 domain-containing protein [Acidobacteriota bacterium]|nr:DUF1460 domain-containing protein [Acidobacteriota bacterium]